MIELESRNLSFQFGDRSVLRDVNLRIAPGDFICLLGPSGCGKSTLLRLLAGLLEPTKGEVRRDSAATSFVFQEPRLLPWRTVLENVLLPFELQGQRPKKIESVLRRVGLWDARGLFPHELSGGMKQRTAIARALVTDPEVLLMDEPFSALDEALRYDLEDLLREQWSEKKMTMVFVTHSIPEAVYLGERVLLMGREQGAFLADRRTALGERTFDLRTRADFNDIVRDLSRILRGTPE